MYINVQVQLNVIKRLILGLQNQDYVISEPCYNEVAYDPRHIIDLRAIPWPVLCSKLHYNEACYNEIEFSQILTDVRQRFPGVYMTVQGLSMRFHA